MNPWAIIGWIVLVLIVVPPVFLLLEALARWVGNRWRWLRTRKIPPALGQTWRQEDANLHVERIYDNGRIGIRTSLGMGYSNASWSEGLEEWKQRVKDRKLWLVRGSK